MRFFNDLLFVAYDCVCEKEKLFDEKFENCSMNNVPVLQSLMNVYSVIKTKIYRFSSTWTNENAVLSGQ